MFDAIAHKVNYFTASHSQENAERTVAAETEALTAEKHVEVTQKTRGLSEQEETQPDGRQKDTVELSREAQEITELKARDKEVRAHEAAHAAAGGAHAGAPSYQFERGPDGQSYAVSGEVSIDVSPVSGDPEATLQKAQQIRAAALAPAEPSAQDMKVAQRSQAMAADARAELNKQRSENVAEVADSVEGAGSTADRAAPASADSAAPKGNDSASVSHLSSYA